VPDCKRIRWLLRARDQRFVEKRDERRQDFEIARYRVGETPLETGARIIFPSKHPIFAPDEIDRGMVGSEALGSSRKRFALQSSKAFSAAG
jgi:hypothetical protein